MFLADLLVVFAVAAVVVFAFGQARVPSVIGLLVSGVIIGPYGLSLVADVHSVELLAEIGVVVLLFTVGLEFSLSRLVAMLPVMVAVGLPQVAVTTAVVAAATAWYLGSVAQGIFAGLLVAMSSTAIVLKLLADRGATGTPAGRIAVAVLLFQDLLVVAAMLAVPLLAAAAGRGEPAAGAAQTGGILPQVALGGAAVAAVLISGRLAVPRILHEVVRLRNRELFLITIVLICLGTAALTARVGLSLALGAFLAGLALAESEYGHQVFTEMLPFRDTLASLFFVSVGMLLDVRFLAANAGLVAVTVVAIVVAKTVATALPAVLAGHPLRTALVAGATIAQVGEFSFVLGSRGLELGLLADRDYQTFLAAAVLTMAATPLAVAAMPRLLDRLAGLPALRRWLPEAAPAAPPSVLADHVIIAGFGLNGRTLATALGECGIPHVVLEVNPQTVRLQRAAGLDIQFGDCTRAAVLDHAGIRRAGALVIAISDPASTRRAVGVARQLAPAVPILVRSEYIAEVEDLVALGATEVVPAEFETALALFERVLGMYDVPAESIDGLVERMRLENYGLLRGRGASRVAAGSGVGLVTVVLPADSPAAGRSIGELAIRSTTGATVMAVRRAGAVRSNPGPGERLAAGDGVSFIGTPAQRVACAALLAPAHPGGPEKVPVAS
ncbi:MAG: potassium transporter KefB [Planctomycetes bacterium]|nr:potassium transporter KefB [Planctomycetota bacterium]